MSDRERRPIAHALAAHLPFFYGWVVVGCAMGSAFVRSGGAVATLTVFVAPMSDQLGWTRTEMSLAVSIGGVMAALSAPGVGVLADRYGSGLLLAVSALVLGLASLGLAQTDTLLWFYVVYCIARMTFASPFEIGVSTAIAKWFTRRRPLAMSYVNIASNLGLTVMPLIVYAAMGGADWRMGWIAIGVTVLSIGVLPNLLLLVRQPEDIGLQPDRLAKIGSAGADAPTAPVREKDFTRRQAIRTPALWLIMGFTAFVFPVQAGISLHQVPHLLERGLSPLVAVSAVSTFSLVAALSGLAFGYFARRHSSRAGLCIVAVSLAASAAAFIAVQSAWQAYLAAILFGVGIGGLLTLLPVIWADYFGRGNFGAIRGMTLPVQVISQATGPVIAGASFDWGGGYEFSLGLFAGFAIIAAILVFFARPPKWR